jgi:hypothetical protein
VSAASSGRARVVISEPSSETLSAAQNLVKADAGAGPDPGLPAPAGRAGLPAVRQHGGGADQRPPARVPRRLRRPGQLGMARRPARGGRDRAAPSRRREGPGGRPPPSAGRWPSGTPSTGYSGPWPARRPRPSATSPGCARSTRPRSPTPGCCPAATPTPGPGRGRRRATGAPLPPLKRPPYWWRVGIRSVRNSSDGPELTGPAVFMLTLRHRTAVRALGTAHRLAWSRRRLCDEWYDQGRAT